MDVYVDESAEDTHEVVEALAAEDPISEGTLEDAVEEDEGTLEVTSADVVAKKAKERADKKIARTSSVESDAPKLVVSKKKRRSKSSA